MQEPKLSQDFKQKYLSGFVKSFHDSCKPLSLAAKIAFELQTDHIKPGQGQLRKNLLLFFVWTPTALNKGQWDNYSIAEIEHAAQYSTSLQKLIDTIDQAIYITDCAIKKIANTSDSQNIPFHWRIIMVLLKQDELSFIESNILKQSISITLSDKKATFALSNISDFLSFDTSFAGKQLDEQFLTELTHTRWDKSVGLFKKEPPLNIKKMRGFLTLAEKKNHLKEIETILTRGTATINFYQKWRTLFHFETGTLIEQNPKTQKRPVQIYLTSKEVIEELIACYEEVFKEHIIDPRELHLFLDEAIIILQKDVLAALEKLTPENPKLLTNHPEFSDYQNVQIFLKDLISFYKNIKQDIYQKKYSASDNFQKALNKTITTLTNVLTAYQNACQRFESLTQNCNDSTIHADTSSVELQEYVFKSQQQK